MECPKAVLFDLDETLAESFQPPTQEMITKVRDVLALMPVAVLTGRTFSWIEPEFLPKLVDTPDIRRFFVFPESAAQCLQWNGSEWQSLYASTITTAERARIHKVIEESVAETHVLDGLQQFGDRLLDKSAMVSFACLGYQVPADMKYTWDPGNERRTALQKVIAAKLPDLEVALGGATTIDVTEKGLDKTRGVMWLADRLQCPPSDMLYIGDALYEGGNDYVVIATGIQTRKTSGPKETLSIIDELLSVCAR